MHHRVEARNRRHPIHRYRRHGAATILYGFVVTFVRPFIKNLVNTDKQPHMESHRSLCRYGKNVSSKRQLGLEPEHNMPFKDDTIYNISSVSKPGQSLDTFLNKNEIPGSRMAFVLNFKWSGTSLEM